MKSFLLNGTAPIFFRRRRGGRRRIWRALQLARGGRRGSCAGLRRSAGGRFRLDEFDLRVGVAQFRQLGLQQRVVARIVHQAEMILKFRVETDDQNVFLKRNRIAHPAR